MTPRYRYRASDFIDLSGWRVIITALCLLALVFGARMAFGQDLTPDAIAADPGIAISLLTQVQHPGWQLFIGVVLIGIVALCRRFGAPAAKAIGWKRVAAFLSSDRAGPIFVFLLAALGMLVTAIAAGKQPTLLMVVAAGHIGFVAIGGYVGFRKVLGISSAPAPATVS